MLEALDWYTLRSSGWISSEWLFKCKLCFKHKTDDLSVILKKKGEKKGYYWDEMETLMLQLV